MESASAVQKLPGLTTGRMAEVIRSRKMRVPYIDLLGLACAAFSDESADLERVGTGANA